MNADPGPAVTASRDGVVESAHLAHAAICTADGRITAIAGDAHAITYPRSALKPFQATAVRRLLADHDIDLSGSQLAIGCASHTGSDDHQVEAASLLAEAGLDESALRCPPAWPTDPVARSDVDRPDPLSHNCSGKHAAMLWAQVAAGGDPAAYLDPTSPVQRRITSALADLLGAPPQGPGIDGCGAPAWRCPVADLAAGFARLAEGGTGDLAAVRDAMAAHPALVGASDLPDTAMMEADAQVIAKRGAEGVMAVGLRHPVHGPLGIAVKVVDGGDRAAAPLAAAVLEGLGATVPPSVRRVPVLGGGGVHGAVEAAGWVVQRAAAAFG